MKKVILAGTILLTTLVSCTKIDKNATQRVVDVNLNPDEFLNFEHTKKQYNAHSGEFYNAIDSVGIYGAGYVKKIDDTLRGYAVDICVTAWVREILAPSEGAIAVSLNKKGGETKEWTGLKVKPENFKPNEWIQITDTFRYKNEVMNDIDEIKIFAMKQNGVDFFDIDDLRIKYIFHK